MEFVILPVLYAGASYICAILRNIIFLKLNVKRNSLYISSCDPGYAGAHCVPAIQLPTALRDSFDLGITHIDWPEVYGGEPSNICGMLVSGKAFMFYKVSVYIL